MSFQMLNCTDLMDIWTFAVGGQMKGTRVHVNPTSESKQGGTMAQWHGGGVLDQPRVIYKILPRTLIMIFCTVKPCMQYN